jgi:hypothetical protein
MAPANLLEDAAWVSSNSWTTSEIWIHVLYVKTIRCRKKQL